MADTYKVTTQNRSVEPNGTGGFTRTVEIAFVTIPSNVAGAITVPETQYNADAVRPLLEEAAANIEAIHAL